MPDYRAIDTACTPDNLPPPKWVLGYLQLDSAPLTPDEYAKYGDSLNNVLTIKRAHYPHWCDVLKSETAAVLWNILTEQFETHSVDNIILEGTPVVIEDESAGVDRLLLEYKFYSHLFSLMKAR
jgi:hypothetical protein